MTMQNQNPKERRPRPPADAKVVPTLATVINIGFCQCGCGCKTNIARQSDPKKGWSKGQPHKFLKGHRGKFFGLSGKDNPHYGKTREEASNWKGGKFKHQSGYVYVLQPSHPQANHNGYVHEAILIIEVAMGKLTRHGFVPHHVNGIKNDNRPINLVACENNAYHTLLHRRLRAYLSCGNASWRRCNFCQEYGDPDDPLTDMYVNASHSHHRGCKAEWSREYDRKNRERKNENQRNRRKAIRRQPTAR
jgi:hypothetical protein